MRRVAAYTTLALGVALGGSAYAGGVPAPECPSLDQKVDQVTSFMKDNNVKFDVAPNKLSEHVSMNGKINVDGDYVNDAGIRGRTLNYTAGDDALFYVNNANLMTQVDVNKYVSANVDLAYLSDNPVRNNASNLTTRGADDGSAFSNNADISVDEAYVTLKNLTGCQPFVLRAGKMYNAFGSYDEAYPMIYSPVQLLTQQRTTNVELAYGGYYGLYGEVFGIHGDSARDRAGELRVNNFGGKLAYKENFYNADFNAAISYVYDVRDSDFFTDVGPARGAAVPGQSARSALKRADAASAHVDVQYGPFGIQSNYASTLNDVSNTVNTSNLWGVDVHGDYKFKFGPFYHKLGAGYQGSGHFNNFQTLALRNGGAEVPKSRWFGDFSTKFSKNVKTTIMYSHSEDYSGAANNGSANRVMGRLGVEL